MLEQKYPAEKAMLPIFLTIQDEKDRKDLAELYDQCSKVMYAVAFNILKNPTDAEDAVMDATKRIILNHKKFFSIPRHKRLPLAVIYVRHTAIDYYNRNARHTEKERQMSMSDTYVTEEKAFESRDLSVLIDAIKKLPEMYSSTLLLKHHYGHSNKEIAKLLGVTEDVVRARLSRGKIMLREILEKENML